MIIIRENADVDCIRLLVTLNKMKLKKMNIRGWPSISCKTFNGEFSNGICKISNE